MSSPQSQPRPLKELTTWVTSECDLQCKYCFVYKLNETQPHGKMTKETADQLIQFASQNLNPNGNIWFFGAEPLCNIDIIRYIAEKCRKEGHKWTFGATTNCTLITEEIAQWMKQYNFGINCSIDGLKESHNTNRVYPNGTGSWDDAWKGLSYVRKYLNPNPQLRWTVTPSTTKGIAEGIRTLVEEHKLTTLAVDFVYEVDWAPQDLATLKTELEIFRDYYSKWMERGIPVFSMWIRDANAAVTRTDRKWLSRCGLGQGAVGVDYDGTLYPCHRFVDSREIKIGDIYHGFNPNQRSWAEKWRIAAPYCEKPQKCLDCNYKAACTGGCVAMNYDVFGDVHVNAESFCTIKQLITDVFGDLCTSLQDNPTFQKIFRKTPPHAQNINQKEQKTPVKPSQTKNPKHTKPPK
ncbi:MAG: SPASM domain-containing protein [Candidatus Bathyarchaeota archaeon]|nr:SPASM domain-containing protein [Candidatus Bathyarchaeota archaeon]